MNEGFMGTGVALVTPFDSNKKIDFTALEKIVNHVINGGVEHLVVLGTTGESATLDKEEKEAVVKAVVEINKGRRSVVVGMGGNSTHQVVHTIEKTDFTGIDAILSVAPYYNKPSQEGIFEHFAAIAKASPVPVVLYNVPGRTASNISATTAVRLAEKYPNIIGVKEASGNFQQIMQIIKDKPDHFNVISGDDSFTVPMIHLGAKGVISVVANSHPKGYSRMVRAALEGNRDRANTLQFSFLDLIQALFEEWSPAGVKATLELMGLCKRHVRLPLTPASDKLIGKLKELIHIPEYS
jgi:4-hydroxy-tetrahydrodipicolinate synthase